MRTMDVKLCEQADIPGCPKKVELANFMVGGKERLTGMKDSVLSSFMSP